MADAIIEIVGQDDLPTIAELHNLVFRPPLDPATMKRRFRGRYNPLHLLARVGERSVGYFLAHEHDPHTLLGWSCAVHSEFRRQGVATQLLDAVHEWALNHHYESVRMECPNSAKSMMLLLLSLNYDIAGFRFDPHHGDNVVVLENDLVRDQ